MKRNIFLYICLLLTPCIMHAEQILSTQQRQNAEAAVKRYFVPWRKILIE